MRGLTKKISALGVSCTMAFTILATIPTAAAEGVLWDFSDTEAVTATAGQIVDYNGLEIHLNSEDTITSSGILWNEPGTTTSDNTVVSNNRYIKYTPAVNGDISVIFSGNGLGRSNNKPRLYIVSGSDASCMSKNNSDANGKQATASSADTDTTLTATLVSGRTYYIWAYCYGGTDVKFNISKITFEPKTVTPVTSIKAVYRSGTKTVAEKTVDIGEGHYEGDSYTYISPAFVEDSGGTLFAVGEDFNTDTDGMILNSSSTGVNSALAKSVSLASDTVIEYEVTETDAVFYNEWEQIVKTEGADFANGRYYASCGTMTTASGVNEFYNVPSSGYYQITVLSGAGKVGTEIFRSAAEAEAAAEYGGGTAIISIMSSSSNQYYGNCTVKTVLLYENDMLAIKGFGKNSTTDRLDYIVIRPVTEAEISGSDGLSILPGGMNAKYELMTDIADTPEWSVSGVDGVAIDRDGVLTVSGNATEGTAVIRASLGGVIEAEKNVVIKKAEITGFEISGTTAINKGEKAKFEITNVKDQFGNDITEYVSARFSSSAPECVSLTEDGTAFAKAKGEAVISAEIGVSNGIKTAEKLVKSDNYSIIADAAGDTTDVDISDMVSSDSITGYTVTSVDENGVIVNQTEIAVGEIVQSKITECYTSEEATVIYPEYDKDGRLLNAKVKPVNAYERFIGTDGMLVWNSLSDIYPVQYTSETVNKRIITADTKGAVKVEVSPVYTYSYAAPDKSEVMALADSFADGDYSFEITKAPENRYGCVYDLYINGAMIGNNVNEKGIGREFTKGDELVYRAEDVTVTGGSIELEKADFYYFSGGLRVSDENKGISKIVISKSPTIANRRTKVYILGDSLVAKYYGEPVGGYTTEGLAGTARTGWGQLIGNFFNDSIDVINLANSGQWAKGLQDTAFTGVMQSAKEGDYLILESGWNDKSHSNPAEMKQAVTEMVEACEAKGIIPILVTPNVSSSTFSAGENTQLAPVMREAANELQAVYGNVRLIDLAKLSYDFLSDTYGTDTEAMTSSINLGHAGSSQITGEKGDSLHLSYLGAMKYAELVAQSMSDQGIEFINKSFSWSLEDKSGNLISVQVK